MNSEDQGAPQQAERGIKSIEVGGRLLVVLTDMNDYCSLTELARASRMTTSKAHRYLVSFQQIGLVKQDPKTSRYALGDLALRMGQAATNTAPPLAALQHVQTQLRNQTGHTVVLSIWSEIGPIVLSVEEGSSPVITTMAVGTKLPLFTSAAGRIFAAFMPWSTIQPIAAQELQNHTFTATQHDEEDITLESLYESIESTRERRLMFRTDSLRAEIGAVAAPFHDPFGKLIGVLTAIGSNDICNDEALIHTLQASSEKFRVGAY